jgi:PAS domain S-box-containing protein
MTAETIDRLLDFLSRDFGGDSVTFFRQALTAIHELTGIRYACIARFDPSSNNKIETVACMKAGQIISNFTYELNGSPCQITLDNRRITKIEDLTERFPDFPFSSIEAADRYIGIPLLPFDFTPIGIFALVLDDDIQDTDDLRRLLRIASLRIVSVMRFLMMDSALRKSSERYQAIVDTQTELISRYRPDGSRTFVNDAYCRYHNVRREDLIGRSAYAEMSEEALERLHRLHHELTPESPTAILVNMTEREDGSESWVEWTKQGLFDDDGELIEIQAVGRDVTKQKRAEHGQQRALLQAEEANRVKSEFLANMSHELRTPLNSIIGFAEVIDTELFGPHSSQKYKEYAHDIGHSAGHLLTVINDILDLSRIEAGKTEVAVDNVHVGLVANECLAMTKPLAESKNQSVDNNLPSELPTIQADPRHVRQIFINLLTNAIKYTGEGGQISLAGTQDGKKLTIVVTDNGRGIAPEDRERVLEPFGQSRQHPHVSHPGTGLGLSICKQLTELNGGSLVLKSTLDVGTQISVTFPVSNHGG